MGAFDGGLAAFCADELIISPQCCGDLSNLEEWYQAAEFRGPGETGLWIGHPHLVVTYDQGQLNLRFDETRENKATVSPEELLRELDASHATLRLLSAALEPFVSAAAGYPCKTACDALAGISRLSCLRDADRNPESG